jgi:hypothetical protein
VVVSLGLLLLSARLLASAFPTPLLPKEFDLLHDSGLYALPIFVDRIVGRAVPPRFSAFRWWPCC